MGDEDTGKKKKRVVVESLGWLTESSIMPKKHRAIAGVGPSSILELKAQLYKSQEEAKSTNANKNPDQLEFHRAKKKITPNDPYAAKNSGVDDRSHKDKLVMKAEKDGSASYAALEKKAELYEKLARGEVSDEEDKEKYCVDFFSKTLVKEESHQPQNRNPFSTEVSTHESDTYDEPMLPDSRAVGLGRAAGTVDNDEHKRFVREVHEEVNQAREKVSELKVRRQEQVAARREKLKQAYLKKQLEKLKAQSKQDNGIYLKIMRLMQPKIFQHALRNNDELAAEALHSKTLSVKSSEAKSSKEITSEALHLTENIPSVKTSEARGQVLPKLQRQSLPKPFCCED